MSADSFIEAACISMLFVLNFCVLVHICSIKCFVSYSFVSYGCMLVHTASVVTKHITITSMVKNQPQQVVYRDVVIHDKTAVYKQYHFRRYIKYVRTYVRT